MILAGGKGTRLAPYTTVFPKPLVPIGEMPILEIVVRQLVAAGVTRITMAVGHLAELIEAFFRAQDFGVPIEYSREATPLGTAGPLALLGPFTEPFLVMNGDILTTLSYKALVEHHASRRPLLTIATYERRVTLDFGILTTDPRGRVTDYFEKPTHTHRVSMGVYVFDPEVLAYIPAGAPLDFPELVKRLLGAGRTVEAYPFDGEWLDIGRADDYAKAVEVFGERRERFLPGR